MGFVLWEASTILPAEMIAALGGRDSDPNKPTGVAMTSFAACDGLMVPDGQTLQSLTSFSLLDEVAPEILAQRFFLIARALEIGELTIA
jgi:hypothetical protein